MKNLLVSPQNDGDGNHELTPEFLYQLIKNNAGKIEEIEKRTGRNTRELNDIKEEYPLLPPEADDLASAVKRKGVEVLGGKKSNAYQDTALRKRVYMDIYCEIKRQYGLIKENGAQLSYKKLKRKYLSGAFAVIDNYVCPISIQNDIEAENEIDFGEE